MCEPLRVPHGLSDEQWQGLSPLLVSGLVYAPQELADFTWKLSSPISALDSAPPMLCLLPQMLHLSPTFFLHRRKLNYPAALITVLHSTFLSY